MKAILKTLFFCFLELIFITYFLSCRWILLPYFKFSYMIWLNIFIKECPTFYIMKNIVYNKEDDVCIASSIIVFVLLVSLQKKKKTKKVFNFYMKHNRHVIICKVGVVSFSFVFLIIQSCSISYSLIGFNYKLSNN